MFLAPLLAALLFMVKTISTLVNDSFELTRGQLNYEGKGKKTREELRFTSIPPVPLAERSL